MEMMVDERLRLALEQLEERSQRLCTRLRKADEGSSLSAEETREALHDAVNIAASMRGLRRLIRKLSPPETA